MAGHMGVRKTYDRIMQNFYWPGIFGDFKRFCRSCDICQRTVDKGTVSRAPVQNMPLVNVAFDNRLGVDSGRTYEHIFSRGSDSGFAER